MDVKYDANPCRRNQHEYLTTIRVLRDYSAGERTAGFRTHFNPLLFPPKLKHDVNRVREKRKKEPPIIDSLTFLSVANPSAASSTPPSTLSIDTRVINARRHPVSRDKALERKASRFAPPPPVARRGSCCLTRRRLSRLYEWR